MWARRDNPATAFNGPEPEPFEHRPLGAAYFIQDPEHLRAPPFRPEERLAGGEIDIAEFEKRKRALGD
jgi:hypothetical protein